MEATTEAQALTEDQTRFLDAYAECGSINGAANSTGISDAKLKGWRKEPDFTLMLNFLRSERLARKTPEELEKQARDKEREAAKRAADRERLESGDPRVGLAVFVVRELLGVPMPDVGRMFGFDPAALSDQLAQHTPRWQSLSALPLALAITELRSQAA